MLMIGIGAVLWWQKVNPSHPNKLITPDPTFIPIQLTPPPNPTPIHTVSITKSTQSTQSTNSIRSTPLPQLSIPTPTPTPVVTTTTTTTTTPTTAPAPSTSFTFANLPSVWYCITGYESSHKVIDTNPYSGDQGAFQFAISTWNAYKLPNYPTIPNAATLYQQYQVALRLEATDGYSPWTTHYLCGV